MEVNEFESRELDLFLDKYCAYSDIRYFLLNLFPEEHPQLIECTKLGIKNGIADFLAANKNPKSIYLSNLADFCFDDSTEKWITKILEKEMPDLSGIVPFSTSLSSTYKTFVYNESFSRFKEEFG